MPLRNAYPVNFSLRKRISMKTTVKRQCSETAQDPSRTFPIISRARKHSRPISKPSTRNTPSAQTRLKISSRTSLGFHAKSCTSFINSDFMEASCWKHSPLVQLQLVLSSRASSLSEEARLSAMLPAPPCFCNLDSLAVAARPDLLYRGRFLCPDAVDGVAVAAVCSAILADTSSIKALVSASPVPERGPSAEAAWAAAAR